MSEDRIESNHSYSKLKKELEGADSFRKLAKFFSLLGMKNEKLNSALAQVPELKQKLQFLSQIPDKFNHYFSARGWIAHESMSSTLMEAAVELAENQSVDLGERKLIDYYCSTDIIWVINTLRSIPELSIRYEQIQLAYQDTILKKYHTCIPLLLMIIDGAVNDIDKNKGFFTDSTNLTAWDSIAAHNSGLSVLRDIFNKGRNRTNQEPIYLPYRNGILHGRDLNYANEIVAAKCWALLISIKDWAKAVKEGKRNPPPLEKELTLAETFQELKESLNKYEEVRKRSKEINKMVEQWKPRNIKVGIDIPENGTVEEYPLNSPEKEAIGFLNNWANGKYGSIARDMYFIFHKEVNWSKESGKIRELLESKKLVSYKIESITDFSPAITEIGFLVTVQIGELTKSKPINLRLMCVGPDNQVMIREEVNSKWKIMDTFDYQIISIY